tara:strand:+ start:471 stop:1436 length:966 start_codon:yes stop_codon:yes gene_type:complete
MTKEILIKLLVAALLIFVLGRCAKKTLGTAPGTSNNSQGNTAESFRPYTPLAIVLPQTYEDVIKEAFRRMSSGETVPADLSCGVKMDIDSGDSISLTNYIVDKLKETINTLPTPSRVAPMIGEDFAVIDLAGYIVQGVAVVSFTLFHRRRYFAISCRAVASRGSDEPDAEPWFVHKIHYAQESFANSETPEKSQPEGKNERCNVRGSTILDIETPETATVSYPESMEPYITQLQKTVGVEVDRTVPMGVDTRLVKDASLLKADPSLASYDGGVAAKRDGDRSGIKGSSIMSEASANAGHESLNKPSASLGGMLASLVAGKK